MFGSRFFNARYWAARFLSVLLPPTGPLRTVAAVDASARGMVITAAPVGIGSIDASVREMAGVLPVPSLLIDATPREI